MEEFDKLLLNISAVPSDVLIPPPKAYPHIFPSVSSGAQEASFLKKINKIFISLPLT